MRHLSPSEKRDKKRKTETRREGERIDICREKVCVEEREAKWN